MSRTPKRTEEKSMTNVTKKLEFDVGNEFIFPLTKRVRKID